MIKMALDLATQIISIPNQIVNIKEYILPPSTQYDLYPSLWRLSRNR